MAKNKTSGAKIPSWVEISMQGIVYWIGHRRCVYKGQPLTEGALVAELCNLIYANLNGKLDLQCEVQYSNYKIKYDRDSEVTAFSRADLVIGEKQAGSKLLDPKFIIEVKRASAPKKEIYSDLCRLAQVHKSLKEVRTFLFVISEAGRPRQFVTSEGKASEKNNYAQYMKNKIGVNYKVRRVLKAAHTFEKKEKVQYACIIEVYPKDDSKLL